MAIRVDHRGEYTEIDVGGTRHVLRMQTKDIPELVQKLCKVPMAPELANTFPVVCYFADDLDRDEFIAAVMLAKPGMRAVKP